jgi:hypothetical protein
MTSTRTQTVNISAARVVPGDVMTRDEERRIVAMVERYHRTQRRFTYTDGSKSYHPMNQRIGVERPITP